MKPKIEKMALSIFVYHSQQMNYYVAHCFELDLVVTDISINKTIQGLGDVIARQLKHGINCDNLENVFRKAPESYFNQFKCVNRDKDLDAKVELYE